MIISMIQFLPVIASSPMPWVTTAFARTARHKEAFKKLECVPYTAYHGLCALGVTEVPSLSSSSCTSTETLSIHSLVPGLIAKPQLPVSAAPSLTRVVKVPRKAEHASGISLGRPGSQSLPHSAQLSSFARTSNLRPIIGGFFD